MWSFEEWPGTYIKGVSAGCRPTLEGSLLFITGPKFEANPGLTRDKPFYVYASAIFYSSGYLSMFMGNFAHFADAFCKFISYSLEFIPWCLSYVIHFFLVQTTVWLALMSGNTFNAR